MQTVYFRDVLLLGELTVFLGDPPKGEGSESIVYAT